MLPGSAQTVRDLSGSPMAAKLAARHRTSNPPRRAMRKVSLYIVDLRKWVLTKPPAVLDWTRAREEGFSCGGLVRPRANPEKNPVAFATGYIAQTTPTLHTTHSENIQRTALRNS